MKRKGTMLLFLLIWVLCLQAQDTIWITAPLTHWHDTVLCMQPNAVIMVAQGAKLLIENCTIQACDNGNEWKGIQVSEGAILQMQHTLLADADFGVMAVKHATVTIEHNTFERNKCAISLYMLTAGRATITNNHVEVNKPGAPGMGITVYGMGNNFLYAPVWIEKNTITLGNATKGICLIGINAPPCGVEQSRNGGCGYFHIQKNTIHLNSTCNSANCAGNNVRNQDAIFISNSSGIYVRENIIDRTTAPNFDFTYGYNLSPNPNLYPHGITLQSNTGGNNQIYCNTVSNTYTGYRVEGDNPNVDFLGNNIGNPNGTGNRLGLHVLDLATMVPTSGAPTHYDKGNRWYGTYSGNNNNIAAWNANITNPLLINASKFEVAPSSPWNPSTYTPNSPNWIDQTGTLTTSPCGGLLPSHKTDEVRPYEPIGDFERGVMSRRWQYARFAEVTQYELDKQVFARIREAEKLRPLSGTETAFLEKNKTGSIGRFAELNQELATLDEAAQFVDSAQWAERIEQLRQMNAAIEVNTAHEQLQKQVNDIYLSSRATKTGKPYTREQQSVLVDVAQRCFHEFGAAVFQSRGMLGAYDTRSYDAYDHCVEQPELPAVTNRETYYRLMPNPAREQVTISKVGGLFELEQISINGLSGDELLRYEKLGSGNQFTVSTKALPAGTYLCHITQGEHHIATLKLVIVP